MRDAAFRYGQRAVAKAAEMSLQHLSAVLLGRAIPRDEMLDKLVRGVAALDMFRLAQEARVQAVLSRVRSIIAQEGLRPFARRAGVDPGNLAHLLRGSRKISSAALAKLELAVALE